MTSPLAADRSAPASSPERKPNISDALAGLLAQLGVEEAWGVTGGAIAPFSASLAKSPLRVLHARHESGAAFAATESSLASGKPTMVWVTTGPGITNVLTGMMAARWEGAKVVLISGGTPGTQRGRWPAQETSGYTMPISGLFTAGPLFHYATILESPAELDQIAWRLAAGIKRPGPFVAHVNLPIAMQTAPAPSLPQVALAASSVPGCPPQTAEECARMLTGKPFVIWVGYGARGAADKVRRLAERTGAPVMCTPRAKGVFPEDHPQFLGVTGMGGHASVEAALEKLQPAHTLVLGSRLAETASFWDKKLAPSEGFIHVDLDPEVPGTAFQTARTFAVQSEIGAFLDALLEKLPEANGGPRVFPRPAEAPLSPSDEGPARPQYLLESIQRVVVDGSKAVVLAESGNSFAWAIHMLRMREPGRFRVSSSFGSMGHVCAGVVGAALARGDTAVALVGDGSMLMNNEVSTAVKYGAKAVWIVLNDGRYGMVAQGMEALGFDPVEADFPRVDFVTIARGMGADGVRVDKESQIEPALRQAMAAGGPFVVDVHVDRSVPGPWMKRIQNLILQGAKGAKRAG